MTDMDLNAGAGEVAAASGAATLHRDAGVRLGAPAWRRYVGSLALLTVLGTTVWLVLDAASAESPMVPRQPAVAGWMNGPGSELSYRTFLAALLIMCAGYVGALVCRRELSQRAVVGTIIAANLILFIGPILISQDVFQYIAYGRLGAVHGIDPFSFGPIAARHDPVFRYLGDIWHRVPSAYGPLFTLTSYPIALLGIHGAVWGMKLLALAASLGTMWLVWRCALLLKRDAVTAIVLLGLNPLWLVYGLGGAHNDLLMDALMMGGVLLTLRDADARGAASIVAGAAMKATAIVVLPFMLLARRRVALIWGTIAALAVVAAISYAAFGVHGLDFVSVLKRNSTFVSSDSFPLEVAHLFGLPGVFRIDRTIAQAGAVVAILWLLWRTWRGYDWIAGSAWALLLLAITTTWLLAWYLLWALPLAVLSRDRRVLWATLAIMALFIIHQTAPLFSPTT